MDETTKMEITIMASILILISLGTIATIHLRNSMDQVLTQVVYQGAVVYRGPSCAVRIGSAGDKPRVTIMGGPLYLVTKAVYAGDQIVVEGPEVK